MLLIYSYFSEADMLEFTFESIVSVINQKSSPISSLPHFLFWFNTLQYSFCLASFYRIINKSLAVFLTCYNIWCNKLEIFHEPHKNQLGNINNTVRLGNLVVLLFVYLKTCHLLIIFVKYKPPN